MVVKEDFSNIRDGAKREMKDEPQKREELVQRAMTRRRCMREARPVCLEHKALGDGVRDSLRTDLHDLLDPGLNVHEAPREFNHSGDILFVFIFLKIPPKLCSSKYHSIIFYFLHPLILPV